MNTLQPHSESELKLEFQGNLQLKYSVIDKPEIVRQRFHTLLDILDIKVISDQEYQLDDQYYDDEQNALQRAGLSLRVRRGEGEAATCILTLKSSDLSPGHNELRRDEYEHQCQSGEVDGLLSDLSRLRQCFPRLPNSLSSHARFRKILSIKNDRLAIEFATKISAWRMCYDRFYFFNPREGTFSQYFCEIEVEHIGQGFPPDPQLAKISKGLASLFGLASHKLPKLKRGIELMANPTPQATNVCTIGFDIIGYSQKSSDVQLQIIQKLNKFVKDAAQELGYTDLPCIYIPTGDGMYIVLEKSRDIILKLIVRVQELTKQHNQEAAAKHKFQFRTGIHSGSVFRYSDVNENLNVAGNGINIAARVLGFGSEWHILSSAEGMEALAANSAYAKCFHEVGPRIAKHGLPIQLYNIFDIEKNFGNPDPP